MNNSERVESERKAYKSIDFMFKFVAIFFLVGMGILANKFVHDKNHIGRFAAHPKGYILDTRTGRLYQGKVEQAGTWEPGNTSLYEEPENLDE